MLGLLLAVLPEADREKAERLVTKYQNLLFAVAYRILNHEQNAEDAVYSAWEKILRHLDQIDETDENRTKGFLVTVTERTALNEYKKHKKRRSVEVFLEESSPYYFMKDLELDNLEISSCIHSLNKRYAEVLLLYYVYRYTLAEIGKLLHKSEATVSRRLKRGWRFSGSSWFQKRNECDEKWRRDRGFLVEIGFRRGSE